jgi:hypothetical protein
MKSLILSAISLFSLSCSNDNSNAENTNLEVEVSILLKDTNGENLLGTPNYIPTDFRIYNLVNGQTEEVYNPDMDYPRNFYINSDTTPIYMRVFLNHSSTEEYPITYIKWNENDIDTLRAFYSRGTENDTGYVICQKIRFNEVLVWDTNIPQGVTGREITITK